MKNIKKHLNCLGCNALCCKYVSVEIDKPKNKKDCQEILWYLHHKNVYVFIESKEWYIQFITKCRHLDKDFKCKIYKTRPKICKEHDIEGCERHGYDSSDDVTFKNEEQFLKYAKEKDIWKN
ncbi:MAG: YkgJ family cysteine cluster protein [Candidatus Nanoarchaeia archaeon]